jgi:hypothetical protein
MKKPLVRKSYLIALVISFLTIPTFYFITRTIEIRRWAKTVEYRTQNVTAEEVLLGNSIEMPSEYLATYYSLLQIKRVYNQFDFTVTNKFSDAKLSTFKIEMDRSDLDDNNKILRSKKSSAVEKEIAAASINSTRGEYTYPETTNYQCQFAISNYKWRKDFQDSTVLYSNIIIRTFPIVQNNSRLIISESSGSNVLNENDKDKMVSLVKRISNELILQNGRSDLIFYKTNAIISYRTLNALPEIGSGVFGATIGKVVPSRKQVELHLFITAGKDNEPFFIENDNRLISFDPETR